MRKTAIVIVLKWVIISQLKFDFIVLIYLDSKSIKDLLCKVRVREVPLKFGVQWTT